MDSDTVVFVGPELARNIKLCVDEKARKAKPYWHRYPEWWLVLTDHINLGGKESLIIDKGPWHEVITINPENPQNAATW